MQWRRHFRAKRWRVRRPRLSAASVRGVLPAMEAVFTDLLNEKLQAAMIRMKDNNLHLSIFISTGHLDGPFDSHCLDLATPKMADFGGRATTRGGARRHQSDSRTIRKGFNGSATWSERSSGQFLVVIWPWRRGGVDGVCRGESKGKLRSRLSVVRRGIICRDQSLHPKRNCKPFPGKSPR